MARTARLTCLLGAAMLAVPGVAAAQPSAEAQAYLDEALGYLQQRHINSEKADWAEIRAAAQARIETAVVSSDTYPAIIAAIRQLGEKHSHFIPQPPPQPVAPAQGAGEEPQRPGSPPMPQIRLAGGRTGYLVLPALNTLRDGQEAGDRYRTVLRKGLERLDEQVSCGWIVDLRPNRGGNMWPMLAGLDPLLGEGPFGYFMLQEGARPWRRTTVGIAPLREDDDGGEPGQRAFTLTHADLPIAVLIGPRTASSGEMAAIALIGRENVRTFGQPSANFTTANAPVRMSDGAFLIVTTSKVADRTGQVYDGPIVPDVDTGSGDAAAAAMEWLEQSCP